MIPDTPPHKNLVGREPRPSEIEVNPLDRLSRQVASMCFSEDAIFVNCYFSVIIQLIVEHMLGKYNKKLSDEQVELLLNKPSSENPLWLSIGKKL